LPEVSLRLANDEGTELRPERAITPRDIHVDRASKKVLALTGLLVECNNQKDPSTNSAKSEQHETNARRRTGVTRIWRRWGALGVTEGPLQAMLRRTMDRERASKYQCDKK